MERRLTKRPEGEVPRMHFTTQLTTVGNTTKQQARSLTNYVAPTVVEWIRFCWPVGPCSQLS